MLKWKDESEVWCNFNWRKPKTKRHFTLSEIMWIAWEKKRTIFEHSKKNNIVLSLKSTKIWVFINVYRRMTFCLCLSLNFSSQLILLVGKTHMMIISNMWSTTPKKYNILYAMILSQWIKQRDLGSHHLTHVLAEVHSFFKRLISCEIDGHYEKKIQA